ncbi:MAG: type IV toxin-antitoxin system AbiEi family antitoxin domain-containing protein [Polaromonas sp.]|nr:type IV toxin-antitoxin system AbiEi family antitoxin domain-containing protein [Polaromonas sp.]
MTRPYATLQLLAHGPLSRAEFIEITGWSRAACARILAALVDTGELSQPRRGVYSVAMRELAAG